MISTIIKYYLKHTEVQIKMLHKKNKTILILPAVTLRIGQLIDRDESNRSKVSSMGAANTGQDKAIASL
jgi:hypothetical protein